MNAEKMIDHLLELYDDSQSCNYEKYQGQIDDELKSFKDNLIAIITRYSILEDRYLNQDQKHFQDACLVYFSDEPLTDAGDSKNG